MFYWSDEVLHDTAFEFTVRVTGNIHIARSMLVESGARLGIRYFQDEGKYQSFRDNERRTCLAPFASQDGLWLQTVTRTPRSLQLQCRAVVRAPNSIGSRDPTSKCDQQARTDMVRGRRVRRDEQWIRHIYLLYASPACSGFANKEDQQKICFRAPRPSLVLSVERCMAVWRCVMMISPRNRS